MKKFNKVLLGSIVFFMIFSMFGSIVVAADPAMEQQSFQLQAHNRNMFQFQQQTRINISSAVDIKGNINVESGKISGKDFALEIESADGPMNLNMTCTEEQAELGLLNGNRYTVRNRNRFQYQEGFVVNISCNCSQIQARLRIKATNQNRLGEWAYYNHSTSEWVTVPTQVKDGYLEASTDHFSTWTILIPEEQSNLWFFVGIGITVAVAVAIVVGIVVIIIKRR
ncbi:MAG: hypothetical protein P8Y70_00675 [Candidatus Lokiarchaeota archaeon]